MAQRMLGIPIKPSFDGTNEMNEHSLSSELGEKFFSQFEWKNWIIKRISDILAIENLKNVGFFQFFSNFLS